MIGSIDEGMPVKTLSCAKGLRMLVTVQMLASRYLTGNEIPPELITLPAVARLNVNVPPRAAGVKIVRVYR